MTRLRSHGGHTFRCVKEGAVADESLLASTLLELADSLVGDFDLTDLLTLLVDRCVTVVGVSAAGLILVPPAGDLRLAASSSEEMQVVELFEIQSQEGPCLDSFHSGEQVVNVDLTAVNGRWPRFAPVAIEAGFCSVHALPMKLRDIVLGAINLFNADPGELAASDLTAGKALADMATIAILRHRADSSDDELDATTSAGASDEVADVRAFAAAIPDVGAEDDPRQLIPLLERIAQSLNHIWNEARDFGLPGDFARLYEASRSVHRSLISLREHALERGGPALFDRDVVVMRDRRPARPEDLGVPITQRDAAAEGSVTARLQSIWSDGAA